jgi:hypothetical protein
MDGRKMVDIQVRRVVEASNMLIEGMAYCDLPSIRRLSKRYERELDKLKALDEMIADELIASL